MNPSLHPPAPHPGDLPLVFGDVVLSISVTPGDPYRLPAGHVKRSGNAWAWIARRGIRCAARTFRWADFRRLPADRAPALQGARDDDRLLVHLR